ncbi:penicillin-binding protein 1A [Aureimonas leprariae]|uniref:Penicillin-binding protein 1A n=1 Tax=Plantimonas leprariae TaxID=2615207 RepID=A0A7V7TXJ8_9HYPH|nr:penicillin-binding protein 1A [Aureimonas leprariae]KAB0681819.1 penicillin-binding protein 1A [Aureimonas leprariae]
MFRLLGYLFSIACVGFILVAGGVLTLLQVMSKDLPDYQVLADYQPEVTTRFHAGDGSLMAEYAKERRLFLPIQAIPDLVKEAYLSAEDKNFYNHPGVDVQGLGRAVMVQLKGGPMQGGSTITQQVAKNFLLTNERSLERKVKEAILSMRMEKTYSKDKILELYLNEIYLGFGSYGVAAASLAYFDKSVNDLEVQEAAYLAALPKAPENYNPFRNPERALERRNWVIDQMQTNGYITVSQANEARAKPLGINPNRSGTTIADAEYFTEEVRRDVIARYGMKQLYEGGLTVRTTIDPKLQIEAHKALHDGLVEYDQARGWRGSWKTIDIGADWGKSLGEVPAFADVPEWKLAVVLDSDANSARVGIQPPRLVSGALGPDREVGTIALADMKWAQRMVIDGKGRSARGADGVLSRGDVVFVEKKEDGFGYRLRQPPKVQGALVTMDPHTGRVLAMVGGFSYSQSEFNRATQAMRQPGSSFKPIVYAAALDSGYTPASVIMDAPISIPDGNGGWWSPKNYGDEGAGGPSTLRRGIEQSRNLMTVRLARDMGMKLVAEYAERFGVYDKLAQYLPMALGAGETTVMRMVSAYSVMANGGRSIEPSLIDRVQDRYGRTIYKHDNRQCAACNADTWSDQAEPELVDEREQVLDPMTAYQITAMMEGVVQRGTATVVKQLGVPIAGKTGTTNDEKDAWFIGYTPDLVTGLYLGYDNPTPLGHGQTGGGLAAPIFTDFMKVALAGRPPVDFKVPEGMTLVSINRKTGMAAEGEGTITEAFKPGTGPADSYQIIGNDSGGGPGAPPAVISQETQDAITQGAAGGGLF